MGRDHNDLINIKKQVDIQRTLGLKAMTAERVGVLGGIAVGSLQEFLQYARLGEQPGDTPDIKDLLADHEAAIRFLP